MNRRYRTDYLTATSSFLTGMGSVLNLAGNHYEFNASGSPEEANRKALENDWRMVGQDLADAFGERGFPLSRSRQGPLPSPDDLERYCKLIPDGGDRLMALCERQADRRMKVEVATIRSQNFQSGVGQWMGFALGLVGLGMSGVCACYGHDAAGAALGGVTLIGLVSVFVIGKAQQHRSLAEKNPS